MERKDPTTALIAQARNGDRTAFDRLVDPCRARLESLIRSRIGAQLRARLELADVLQETLLRALRSIERFRGNDGESFLRWLGGIAEHVILKAADREKRESVLRLARNVPGAATSPSNALRRDERFDRFQQAFDRLSPEHRQVIQLARIEGLQLKEVAVRMNRSVDAVKQLLSRALRKLRSGFGETESFHLPDRSLDGEGRGDA